MSKLTIKMQAANKPEGRPKRILALRMVAAIVLFSSFITLFSTGGQIYLEYRRDISQIEGNFLQIRETFLEAVASSLWAYDLDLVKTQLQGIERLPDIQYLSVSDEDGMLVEIGALSQHKIIRREFPLSYDRRGQKFDLGTLVIEADLQGVYERLGNRLIFILSTQAAKTFIVSAFMFVLFYSLVGRHLAAMAGYAREFSLEKLEVPLQLKRGGSARRGFDELDEVESAINEMRTNLIADIEERHKTERKLDETTRLVQSLLEATSDAIFVKDLEGRYLLANSATLQAMGKAEADVIGRKDSELFPAESAAVIEKIDGMVIASDQSRISEERLETAYGDTFWLSNKGPMRDPEGKVVGLIGISRNITDAKRREREQESLERRLQQSQKMEAIGTLAGGIAHDFNNILGIIIGYTELMWNDAPKGSATAHKLDQVLKASNRAKELVRQILAFSRQAVTEPVPLQPAISIKEGMKLLRATIPSTIALEADIDPACHVIEMDPTQLHQILMNLSTNAYQAMETTGGSVHIKLQNLVVERGDIAEAPDVKGLYVALSVADNGPGIPPEIRTRIFDPFFTTKGTGQGTGMGLAIIHGIVTKAGGIITCESNPGVGTTFRVMLPASEVAAAVEKISPDALPMGSEHILFVDDEQALLEMGQDMLTRLGYQVTTCADSQDALALFQSKTNTFDLVLTDQTMPGMTGGELSRRLLQIRPELPIIICTGYSTVMSEKKAKSIGIKDYVMKPFELRQLARTLRGVLDNHHQSSL